MRNDVAIATLKWVERCRAMHAWGFLPPADEDSTAQSLLQTILLEAGWADEDLPHTKAAKAGFTEDGLDSIEKAVLLTHRIRLNAARGLEIDHMQNLALKKERIELLGKAKSCLIYQPKAPKSEFPEGKVGVGGRRLGKSKTSELAKEMAGFGVETPKKSETFTGTAVTGIIFDEITDEPEMIALDAKTKLPIVDTSLPDDAEFLNVDDMLMDKLERRSEVIESFVENKDLKLWGTW